MHPPGYGSVPVYQAYRVQSEAPEDLMGPAKGAIAPSAPAWLPVCARVSGL